MEEKNMNSMNQQEIKKYIDALNKVKPLPTFVPVFGGLTYQMAADYFEVNNSNVRAAMNRDGMSHNRKMIAVQRFINSGYHRDNYNHISKDGVRIGFNPAVQAILLVDEAGIAYLVRSLATVSKIAAKACELIDGCIAASIEANSIQVFTDGELGKLRVISKDSESWFVAVDVCAALEIVNPSQALARLDYDEKMTICLNEGHSGQRGGAQSMSVVNEPGLYTLILSSRKPEAKAFKRWITHEVIPTLRKDGAYISARSVDDFLMNPDLLIKLAEKRKEELAAIKELQESNNALRDEVEREKATVKEVNDELIKAKAELAATVAKSSATEDELKDVSNALDTIRDELKQTKQSLADSNAHKEEVSSKLVAARKSNKELSAKVNAYECRDTICALIRAYSYAACGGLKQEADNDFQRELFERHNIDLDLRMKYLGGGKNIVDYLRPDEYDKAANMMLTICKQHGINTDKILSNSSRPELFSRRVA